jgi:hypothetical protein
VIRRRRPPSFAIPPICSIPGTARRSSALLSCAEAFRPSAPPISPRPWTRSAFDPPASPSRRCSPCNKPSRCHPGAIMVLERLERLELKAVDHRHKRRRSLLELFPRDHVDSPAGQHEVIHHEPVYRVGIARLPYRCPESFTIFTESISAACSLLSLSWRFRRERTPRKSRVHDGRSRSKDQESRRNS